MTSIEEAEKEFIKLLNGKALPTKQLTEVAEHYFIVGYQEGKEKAQSQVTEMLDNIDYHYDLKGDADWLMNEIRNRLDNITKKD